MLNDLPVQKLSDAHFGFKKYAKTLASVMLVAETPISFGIFGPWGTGKTSLMRVIYSILEGSEYSEQVIPVWFNAWRYENETHLILPLLFTLHEKVGSRNKTIGDNIKEFIEIILASIKVEFPGKVIAFTFKPGIAENKHKKMSKIANTESFYFDCFSYLRKILHQLDPIRIILFIDDLDRCASGKIIQMFESIKLFLDIPGLIYVLGVDPNILENVISHEYSQGSKIDSSSYIRKMIQVMFWVPDLQSDDVLTYISNNLAALDNNSIDQVSRIINFGAGSNPREIKRLINSFWLRYKMNPELFSPEKTAFFLILQQRWLDIYKAIQTNKDVFIEFCEWYENHKTCNFNEVNQTIGDVINKLSFVEDAWDFLQTNQIDLVFQTVNEINEYLYFSSFTSNKELNENELVFSQEVEEEAQIINNDNLYRWKIFPVASQRNLQKIEKIVYKLPGGYYKNSIQEATLENGFSISRIGSQNITITINIYLKNGEIYYRSYTLNLNQS